MPSFRPCFVKVGGVVQGITLIDAQRAAFLTLVCLRRPVGDSLCDFDSPSGLLVLTLLLLVYFMVEGISKVIFL